MRCYLKYAMPRAALLVTSIAALNLAPCHAAAGTPVLHAPSIQRPAGAAPTVPNQVYKKDLLTKEAFRALPDSAVLDVDGQHITKGELLARAAQAKERAAAQLQAFGAQENANLKKKRSALHQRRAAGLTDANAKVWAEAARLRQAEASAPVSAAHEAIAKEAAELHQRHAGASPAERAQIEQRAQQLLRQLQAAPR